MYYNDLKYKILTLKDRQEFDALALEVFNYQYCNCKVYRQFCSHLHIDKSSINAVEDIPFLPIEFFKTHEVISGNQPIETTFTSSGTTGGFTSSHQLTDLELYRLNFRQIFKDFYGDIQDYVILALLPSYLERDGSSLIYMVDDLIKQSGRTESGFYLHNTEDLREKLIELESKHQKTILIGVSFALLDFVERYKLNLHHTIIMETGGMKGKRKELVREELHAFLQDGFGINTIHSEYGMTELLSQAYSAGGGVFKLPNTMKVFIRDVGDPLSLIDGAKTGGINIIDLANINSCSFLATKDLGRYVKKNELQILGRFDNSDIRGCNLLTM